MFEKVLSTDHSATLVEFKELSAKRKAVEESVNRTSNATDAKNRGLASPCEQVKQKNKTKNSSKKFKS